MGLTRNPCREALNVRRSKCAIFRLFVAVIVGTISLLSYILPATISSQRADSERTESGRTESETVSQERDTDSPTAQASRPNASGSPEASTEAATGAPSDIAEAGSDADAIADPTAAAEQPDSPVEVSLQLVERSWLRVIVDGNEEFEGVLQEGAEQTWTAENAVTVRAGNAGGVRIAINDRPAEVMGEPGAVSEQTFSPESPSPGAEQ